MGAFWCAWSARKVASPGSGVFSERVVRQARRRIRRLYPVLIQGAFAALGAIVALFLALVVPPELLQADTAPSAPLAVMAAAAVYLGSTSCWFWMCCRASNRQRATLVAEMERVRRNERLFRTLVWNASDVLLIIGEDGGVIYQSPGAELVWGYQPQQLATMLLTDLVHPEDRAKAELLIAQSVESPRLSLAAELRVHELNGSWRHFEVVMNNLLADPGVQGIFVAFRDMHREITERIAFDEQLTFQAFHDLLTGMPNRSYFVGTIERALARTARSGARVALLFLDLDNFKVVNDSLGHAAGDELLRQAADRIQASIRPEDTAARLGGDEFTVLIEAIDDERQPIAVAERIAAELSEPFWIEGRDVYVSASIGIALSDRGRGENLETLMRHADVAMYRAKSEGRARYALFDERMNERALHRLAIETDLRRALERGELEVHYQPIVELSSGDLVGFEGLLRWRHPDRGLVEPAEFIPLAEESGLIVKIGEWTIRECCRSMVAWSTLSAEARHLSVSVNVSARQLQEPGLHQALVEILAKTGFDPSRLKLEVTETAMIRETETTMERLRELKGLRIQLAIDDFGTGYSSLAYLRSFPIDVVKIDRSFVDGLGLDPDDTAIVRSILSLARSLNLEATAEGIETEEQVTLLRQLGCRFGQGFYFGRPMEPQAAAEAVRVRRRLGPAA